MRRRELIKVPPVALDLNAPPAGLQANMHPKKMKSAVNRDNDDHKIQDLVDGVDDNCCRCG